MAILETEAGTAKTERALEPATKPLRQRRVRTWLLPRRRAGIFYNPIAQVVLSFVAILILLLSSTDLSTLHGWESNATFDSSSPPTVRAPYYPYLISPSAFPAPDTLPNETGAVSLPQLATQVVDSLPIYQLAFVDSVPAVGTILEVQTGQYNTSIAQNIFTTGFCKATCNTHLPIQWNSPVPIAAYGGNTIQGDAIGVTGSWLFVAAAANNLTSLYFSGNYGTNGSWYSLTGSHPASGGSPRLAVSACYALLTTLTTSNLVATRFKLPCGAAWGPPPPPPIPSPPSGGGHPPPAGQPPAVSIIIPSKSPATSTVYINGSSFTSVTAVKFGGVPATSYSVLTTTQISAVVPTGSGTVSVQVTAGGQLSQLTCASYLTYGTALHADTPEVSSIFPNAAPSGSTVTINGAYFQSSSTVKFGSLTASGVTLVSAGVLHATVPLGTGTVNVTVTNSVGTSPVSCADAFTIQAIPSIISVTTDQNQADKSTVVIGRNFLSNATVYFGSNAAFTVHVTNSTWINTTSPSGAGTVNVTVRQVGYTSAVSCADNFSYGSPPSATAPQIEWVTPTANASFGSVVVNGYNFQANATVFFGGVPSPRVYYASGTALQVAVPLGTGTVPIQVSESAGNSLWTCADRFTIQWPNPLSNFTTRTWTLPKAVDADPTFVGGSAYLGLNTLSTGLQAAILASNVTDSKIVLYRLNSTTQLFVPTKVVPFGGFNGSSPANSIGGTSLSVMNGTSGQVAAASYGQAVFGVFTTFVNGQYEAETVGSANGGTTWGGPYAASGGVGSIRDPEAAISPAGYVYVTWRDNSPGVWEVDQSVYWPSGLSLVQPVAIPGSFGGTVASAGRPTVLVDPFGRAIYAWPVPLTLAGGNILPAGQVPAGGWSGIQYTGAFISAYSAVKAVGAGFNATVPADFENYGGPGLNATRGAINSIIQKLQNDTTNYSRLCTSQLVSFGSLYPNVTQQNLSPVVLGPSPPSCEPSMGLDSSILVDSSGPFSANTYLETQTSNLLEALGVGSMPIPPWVTGLYSPPPPKGGGFIPGTGAKWGGGGRNAIQVNPITVNPDTVFLNATGVIWSRYSSTTLWHNATTVCGQEWNSDSPILYSTNVTIKNQGGTTTAIYTYNSSTQLPEIYVTHLRGLRNGTWSERISVTYKDEQVSSNSNLCPAAFGFSNYTKPVQPPSGWPKNFTATLAGVYTTGLAFYPSNLTLNSTGVNGNPGVMNDTVVWQNTIFSLADAWLNQTSSGTHYNAAWSNETYELPEYLHGSGFQSVPVGRTYKFTSLIRTQNGTQNASWSPPILNGSQVSYAPVETFSFVCPSFTQLANYQKLWWYGSGASKNVSNVSADSATLTWFSNGNNSGWVDYTQGTGIELNQSAMVTKVRNGSSFIYEYTAELHGLQPWGVYYTVAHVRAFSGCVQYLNQTTKWRLQTASGLQLTEQDLPYDSISQAGGGAQLLFQVPTPFTQISTFDNGSLTYTNGSGLVVDPINFLPPVVSVQGLGSMIGWNFNTTYGLNITGLTLNTTYNATLVLNYTTVGSQLYTATSQPLTFVYGKDSSGDGLTDAEKTRGWNVTSERLVGSAQVTSVVPVQPLVTDFATNGLVSDFIEKQFGLNPTTVDSAGSHMLDTWNLTFDMGTVSNPSSPPSSAKLHFWGENGSYNPFKVCLFPGDSSCHSHSVALDLANLSDGSPYDSQVLWSYNALTSFVGLSGARAASWLRAVYGNYTDVHAVSHRTLTVSGKLSWGANPLAASTPSDGVADGARVNPLYDEDLQLNFLAIDVNPNSTGTGCGNLPAGAGFALRFSIPGAPGGFKGYNYSTQSNQCPNGAFGYTLATPVANTAQAQTVSIQFWANNSTGSAPLPEQLPINGCRWGYNVSVGMLNATAQSIALYGNPSQSCAGAHNVETYTRFTYTELPAGLKNRTWLWVPGDNTSLSPLPWGLKRYVAEQSFDLIVINNTYTNPAGMTSAATPLPWGGSAPGMTIYPGLNSILIPRVQFLKSPLGEALFAGQHLPNASRIFGPMLGGSQGGAVVNSSSAGTLADLACYWQKLAVYSSPNLCAIGSNGTRNSSWDRLLVNAATSCVGMNCGGIPSNPRLENSSTEGAGIQSIIFFNLTNNGSLGSNRLDALIAGLIDNSTGGVNGTLQSITTSVASLGFSQPIITALANNSLQSGGLYGAPVSHASSQPRPTILGSLWNLVSGVAAVAGAVFGAVWTLTSAAWQYCVGLASAFATLGGEFLSRTVAGLTAAGRIIANALASLLSWIVNFVRSLLKIAFQWIIKSLNSTIAVVKALLNIAANLVIGVDHGNLGASAASGPLSNYIMPAEAFGIGIAIGINVILVLTTPISLGASFVLSLLFPLLIVLVGGLISLATPSSATQNIITNSLGPASFTVAGATAAAETSFNQTEHVNSTKLVPAVRFNPNTGSGLSNNTTQNQSGYGGDLWAIVGGVVGFGGARILVAGAQAFPADLAAQVGATVAAMTFILLFMVSLLTLDESTTCSSNPALWTLVVVAAIALLPLAYVGLKAAAVGLASSALPSDRAIGVLGAGFGVAAVIFAFLDLKSSYSNRCSWM
jgi:IPT/TIG domain-containing protein